MNAGLDTLLRKARGAERRGERELALGLYREAQARYPRNPRVHESLRKLESAAPPKNDPPQAAFDAAVRDYRRGAFGDAARQAEALAQAHPHSHAVHNLLGAACLSLGDHARAAAAFRQAAAIDPGQVASYNNLAIALRRAGRIDEAEATYRDILARCPDYAEAHYNLAGLLHAQGRAAEAARGYQTAIALKPDYADAHYNLANLLREGGEPALALEPYARAIALRPDHGDAFNNLGCALLALDRDEEAIAAFRRAVAMQPGNAAALVNEGKALARRGELDLAVACFKRALTIAPGDAAVRKYQLFHQAHACDWEAYAEFPALPVEAGQDSGALAPFSALPFEDDPEHQLRRSAAYARATFPSETAPLAPPPPSADGRIRIGYFSSDFHDHATLFLMSGLLRAHDRSRFAIRAYSYGPGRDDAMRRHVRDHVDAFIDIREMDDTAVIARARADALDIAVDLKGFTCDSRVALFAGRLAPVQVSYLGYPGSIGHPCMDYIVADPVVLPEGDERFYSEKVARLAGSYQANDDRRPITPDSRGRAGHGLPEQGFVFASFNHTYKIGPREFDVWMGLLREVEGSVLWLLRSNRWAETNLRAEAARRGVDPARLVFGECLPHGEHLGRLALADLFLDSFAVNAHTTASDALWGGLPVLTLAGRQFAARVCASLLHAVGLPELVTHGEAAYAALALDLARDPARLADLRARLAANRLTHPLFDTATHTQGLEAAYAAMHERRLKGLAPDHFAIA
ncbi:tetratricopeptide repeat protein [Novosphingobium album (ex Liu et al. 2023)]|uniref:protein O-GlcNAc transferase n=1 Tax=Novosphingobium album (ex Liu et al. 2023) TaxID=3031130 RepID=A0ABT5WNF3_9SPHN|nr:tetratricopeptide repeat protein [Novosphingobium album (ex Liu et al. 2023)]MDE8651570.1 tetratricopeptide repeat protein [Novosphingobium album (ex Liu et al. 2023)]